MDALSGRIRRPMGRKRLKFLPARSLRHSMLKSWSFRTVCEKPARRFLTHKTEEFEKLCCEAFPFRAFGLTFSRWHSATVSSGDVVSEDKTLALIVALWTAVAAAILFLFKLAAGYFIANLSVELAQRRQVATKEGKDHLVITVKLSKGDRSTIALHDVRLQIISGKDEIIEVKDGIPFKDRKRIPVNDNRRFRLSFAGEEPKRPTLDFSRYDEKVPVLQMTPGEVTHFDAIAEVPSAGTVRIEVAILGQTLLMNYITDRWWFSKKIGVGQWRASVISLPIDKVAVGP